MKKQHHESRPLSTRVSRLLVISIAAALVALTTGLVIGFSRSKVNAKELAKGEPSATAETTARTYVTKKVGNQTIQIDAQTGQVKPLSPEEAQRLAEALKEMANRSSEGLKEVRHADGTVSMDLEGRFQNIAVARREADGSVVQSCIDSPEAGAAFFGIDPRLVAPASGSGAVPTSKSSTLK